MGSVPPLEELFKMAGLSLPGFLKGQPAQPAPAEESKPEE